MLTIVEARVLGCLMEKEHTVPDQYPLTMSALLSACNQSTSRDPVMRLEEHEVLDAITSMKAGGFTRLVHPSHGRSVTRYRHIADEALLVERDGAALLAMLLLRGPQTVAELRTRTERLHPFASLDDVESSLRDLSERDLVRLLERQPGQKEPRWQQLIAEETPPDPEARPAMRRSAAEPDPELVGRVADLEARLARLEAWAASMDPDRDG